MFGQDGGSDGCVGWVCGYVNEVCVWRSVDVGVDGCVRMVVVCVGVGVWVGGWVSEFWTNVTVCTIDLK